MLTFCHICAQSIIETWQGWPHRDSPIPVLPHVLDIENCHVCGSSERLDNKRIQWVNFHSEGSTGLPDYWLLKIDAEDWYKKWGVPYLDAGRCTKCDSETVISQFNPNERSSETGSNCSECKSVSRKMSALPTSGKFKQ